MSNDNFFGFVRFLKGKCDQQRDELDSACLSQEMFKNEGYQRTVLPLYYFLTRNDDKKMSIDQMKRSFNCGADMISRTRRAIMEKKPIPPPRHNREHPVRHNQILRNLVDTLTRGNGGVSFEFINNTWRESSVDQSHPARPGLHLQTTSTWSGFEQTANQSAPVVLSIALKRRLVTNHVH